MGSRVGGDDDVIADINVTPLVDVVLVLLVIFMITAPVIYQSAIKVQLPKAETGEEAEKSPFSFNIKADGSVLWDEKPMNWASLEQKLKSLGGQAGQETAVISADQAASHGTVIRLMDLLRKHGLYRFAMSVETKAN